MIVGGERWWQIRGLDGIDAEWVTEKEFLSDESVHIGKKLSTEDTNILRMEHLDTVMLYVHGGAYFWGSINTHRYQIIRYARKIKSRAFAVNYRKAPQYPWPCPLQDVLAAYFYLISPPEGALHKAIPPSKIILAGDSAGGGLCITLLTVLRDMGIEQPAGAVLISPWVDLTHSFPSVMENMGTDIIPPHGFIHKPSPIWPIHPVPKDDDARIEPTRTDPPPEPGHADTLRPSKARLGEQIDQRLEKGAEEGRAVHTGELEDGNIGSQAEMLEQGPSDNDESKRSSDKSTGSECSSGKGTQPRPSVRSLAGIKEDDPNYEDALSFWEPKPPKVFMKDPEEQPLELRSQIQIYALNEQLTHPLVSPVLQGSLGNLCPLYIIAGDGEVLRDEIIYLAHKAAHPEQYPTRKGVIRDGRRQKENFEKFQTPTKAKYAYRSIAEFVKHVTSHSPGHLDRNPFPELHRPPSEIEDSGSEDEDRPYRAESTSRLGSSTLSGLFKRHHEKAPTSEVVPEDIRMYRDNEKVTKLEVDRGQADMRETSTVEEPESSQSSSNTGGEHNFTKAKQDRDIAGVIMLRERVDIFGHVRPMEPKEQIPALNIEPRRIGIIKEDPVRRWLTGQEIWDKRFKHAAIKVEHDRQQYENKFKTVIERAVAQGFERHDDPPQPSVSRRSSESVASTSSVMSIGEIMSERRWGPLDVDGERPAPSSIVGRRDNRESIALLKKSIYHSAPVTHKNVPKRSTADAMMAAFDPDDSPVKPPKQSEQQTESNILPMHGLRIWQSLVTYVSLLS
ncbi:hypothetical protein PHLCEN_2v1561 [Hermanssonia centrifuga]|uniref:Alpha/beta hydrolase fold-3 domain-containing protein n=1 Tax=Hermanssonia centrifuga TaxID=98765 RepID=A0A2R6RZG5_9APHY|nr:hypothetical protein PHLCEN_2v1561 [Hermanssonia centrifuga]